MSGALSSIVADSPVLYWILDEAVGTTFRDATGNGNTASQSLSPTLAQPILGTVVGPTFNGTNQSANRDAGVGSVAAVLPVGSTARTLEILVYPTATAAMCVLAYGALDGSAGEDVNFQCTTNGSAASAFSDGVNGGNNKSWTVAPSLSTPTLIAMTYAGGAGGAAVFYKNGVADLTTTLSLATTSPITRVRSAVRADDGRATSYFTGRLAHAAIYASALSATRLLAHWDEIRRAGVSY